REQSDLIAEREAVAADMLPPTPADARVLAGGVLRGGKHPIDLYRAIHQGIAGSPMPGVGDAVSEDDIWNLVAYVQSLLADSDNENVTDL
ncbi:MAG: c-type cytochrome, partial [Planctomycetota bacterium]